MSNGMVEPTDKTGCGWISRFRNHGAKAAAELMRLLWPPLDKSSQLSSWSPVTVIDSSRMDSTMLIRYAQSKSTEGTDYGRHHGSGPQQSTRRTTTKHRAYVPDYRVAWNWILAGVRHDRTSRKRIRRGRRDSTHLTKYTRQAKRCQVVNQINKKISFG